MKRAMKKITATLVSATLVTGLVPALALGAPGASVGSTGAFKDNTGSTDVHVVVQDTRFRIADQSQGATESNLVSDGIWVQVDNAPAALTADSVKWFSKKTAQNEVPVAADDPAATPREWAAGNGVQMSFDAETNSFYFRIDPAANVDALLDAGGTYDFWVEVTCGGETASNEGSPIQVINSKDYRASTLTWSQSGSAPWKWIVEAGIYGDDGQSINGANGKIYKTISLSAAEIVEDDQDTAWNQVHSAAAADQMSVEQAWSVNLADKEDQPAFTGTLATTLDVTDLVETPGSLGDLQIMWMNPYAEGGAQPVILGTAQGLTVTQDGVRTLVSFIYSEAQAGSSGYLGSFVAVKPNPHAQYYTVDISATEGGSVSETSITREEGRPVSFLLFEHSTAEAKYRIDGVYIKGTDTPAPGTLAGNKFTIESLDRDLSLEARFSRIPDAEIPEPGKVSYTMTVGLKDAPTGATVGVVGDSRGVATDKSNRTFTIDGASKPTLLFTVPSSHRVSAVKVTMGGEEQTLSVQGSSLELPLLTANAQVEVSYRTVPSSGGVTAQYAVTATATPASAAVITFDPEVVVQGGTVTYTVKVNPGYQLTGISVTEGGGTTQYGTADLKGADPTKGSTLTLYNVQSAVQAAFSFQMMSKTLRVPHLTSFSHVKAIELADGTLPSDRQLALDPEHPATLLVTVDAEYELTSGDLWLQDEAGARVPFGAGKLGEPAQNADGTLTYRVPITYANTATLSGTALTLGCAPSAKQHHTVNPPTTGTDDNGNPTTTTTAEPDDGFALDGVTIEGNLAYSDDEGFKDVPGFERVDNGDGTSTYWELDDQGNRTGNGVTIDPEDHSVTVVGNKSAEELGVSWETTPVRDIEISVTATGGKLIANGVVVDVSGTTIKSWKTKHGVVLLMTPDQDYVVKSLTLSRDGGEAEERVQDVQEASAQQVADAQKVQAAELVRIVTGADEAYAEGTGSYIYTIGNDYLNQAKRSVQVGVQYGPKQGGNTPGTNPGNTPGTNPGTNPGNAGNGSGSGSQTVVNNGDTVGDGSAPNADGTYNIKASVVGKHGKIDGAATRRVAPGTNCTIGFTPNVGYAVAAISIDGKRYIYGDKSFTFQNVRAGHTLQVEFAAIPYTGDIPGGGNGTIPRKLKALAATGDLNTPGMLALLALATGGLGAAILVNGRRRREAFAGADNAIETIELDPAEHMDAEE